MPMVSAIFRSYEESSAAIVALENAGVTAEQTSLVMTDEARGKHFKLLESSKVDEGAAAGAGVGGLLGAIAGLVAGAGAIVIPGLNLIVTGTIIAGLAGLGAGAATGGVLGGLIGAGIPEHEAKLYDKEIRAGNVLVSVDARDSDQEKMVKEIFANYGADRKAA